DVGYAASATTAAATMNIKLHRKRIYHSGASSVPQPRRTKGGQDFNLAYIGSMDKKRAATADFTTSRPVSYIARFSSQVRAHRLRTASADFTRALFDTSPAESNNSEETGPKEHQAGRLRDGTIGSDIRDPNDSPVPTVTRSIRTMRRRKSG